MGECDGGEAAATAAAAAVPVPRRWQSLRPCIRFPSSADPRRFGLTVPSILSDGFQSKMPNSSPKNRRRRSLPRWRRWNIQRPDVAHDVVYPLLSKQRTMLLLHQSGYWGFFFFFFFFFF
ncbi:hypothetical protein LX36DRAFT_161309 [Colletotrichum falcatum]|nr:hypothetical protein LX36DRAFT_161309 [Colletotrichum falcatum]